MKPKWARWQALSSQERSLLVRSSAYLLMARIGLRCLPLTRLQARLVRVSATARQVPALTPERLAGLLGVAARHQPYRASCLEKALALQALLAHAGLWGELRIGVRRAPAGIEAHAWIEHDGRALGEPADVGHRYLPLEDRTASASPGWRASGLAR